MKLPMQNVARNVMMKEEEDFIGECGVDEQNLRRWELV